MKSINFTIKTNRFSLRAPQMEDIPYIFAVTTYEGFNDGMLWDAPDTEDELVPVITRGIDAWKTGEAYSFCITKHQENSLIGRISIRKTTTKDVWSIGFWTHPEQQKRGVMTEALEAVIRFGFLELSAVRIEASYVHWNKASEKVLQKNAMQFARSTKNGFKKKGIEADEITFAIEHKKWKSTLS